MFLLWLAFLLLLLFLLGGACGVVFWLLFCSSLCGCASVGMVGGLDIHILFHVFLVGCPRGFDLV